MGKGAPSDYERLRKKSCRWLSVKMLQGQTASLYECLNVSLFQGCLLFGLGGVGALRRLYWPSLNQCVGLII